jgi:lipoprotein-anchoring transpeptidase ErfK/SrfK
MGYFTALFSRPRLRRARSSAREVAIAVRTFSVMAVLAVVVSLAFTAGITTPSGALIEPIGPGPSAPPNGQSSNLSVVAQARGSGVEVFPTPSSQRAYEVLRSPTASGDPLVFLVSGTLGSTWLHVYLPSRPNQSQGWIRSNTVTLSADQFLIDVNLSSHMMTVFNNGLSTMAIRIGEGRSALPTPTGTYYIVDLLKQPNPHGEYGPYAFGLSAFSDVLQSFGGGPGEIGIHGTNAPNSFGASISHGCIRVPDETITALAKLLPLGTPVLINS